MITEWVGSGIWEGWRITTDPPSSSHRQPVLVSPDGSAFVPRDILRDWGADEAAERWRLAESTVRNLCADGKVPGAYKRGKKWYVPYGTRKP